MFGAILRALMSRIIIVSNRLPISVSKGDGGALKTSHSNGGLATALKPVFDKYHPDWIGWAGLRRHLTQNELRGLKLPKHLVPINFTDAELTSFYDRYSNGVLWPLLHGIKPAIELTDDDLAGTHQVLQDYAAAVAQRVGKDDVIWVHDYLLMLLPLYLRKLGVTNRIGFFLHTPFFTPDNLRRAPEPDLLLESMRAIDVLGVQTQRDVVSARACGVHAEHFPIGVDFEEFDKTNADLQSADDVAALCQKYGNKQIIFSLSRLDYTKGVPQQIKAIARLAQSRQDFVYRLNVAPSREGVLEYRELKSTIETMVRETNELYSTDDWRPIIYTYQNLDQKQISTLYQASSIQLNLPIKDGMNLVAKEYIAACREPKVLILSREAGAAEQLTDALLVPPTDDDAVNRALNDALDMDSKQKKQKWDELRKNVRTENVHRWSEIFIDKLVG